MEVAKTFDRDGVRYRPGDPLPPNLDKQALEHYKRYGMVREAKPSEAKPAGQRQRKLAVRELDGLVVQLQRIGHGVEAVGAELQHGLGVGG